MLSFFFLHPSFCISDINRAFNIPYLFSNTVNSFASAVVCLYKLQLALFDAFRLGVRLHRAEIIFAYDALRNRSNLVCLGRHPHIHTSAIVFRNHAKIITVTILWRADEAKDDSGDGAPSTWRRFREQVDALTPSRDPSSGRLNFVACCPQLKVAQEHARDAYMEEDI